jgi:hypothetical protein
MANVPTPANFAGANFRVLLNGAALAREAEVSVRHIPGSDNDYIDIAGSKTRTYTFDCWFQTYNDFQNLQNNVGQHSTLNDGEQSYDAVLLKVERKKAMGRGDQRGSATFVISG